MVAIWFACWALSLVLLAGAVVLWDQPRRDGEERRWDARLLWAGALTLGLLLLGLLLSGPAILGGTPDGGTPVLPPLSPTPAVGPHDAHVPDRSVRSLRVFPESGTLAPSARSGWR